MMVTPPLESLDIDEVHDWQMVSAIAEHNLTLGDSSTVAMIADSRSKQLNTGKLSLVENGSSSNDSDIEVPAAKYNIK